MTTITLSNNVSEYSVIVQTVGDIYKKVHEMFDYYEEYDVLHNNIILDENKPLKYYNINEYDTIEIKIKLNHECIEDMDAFTHTLLYTLAEINNYNVCMLQDTGASTSVMSASMMYKLGLDKHLNTNFKGVMAGVGTANCLGIIHNVTVKLNNTFIIQASFRIMECDMSMCIAGLDIMHKYNVVVNVLNRIIKYNNVDIPFLNENDVIKYKEPTFNDNTNTLLIKEQFNYILDSLADDNKLIFVNTMKKIINNIIGTDDFKFRTLPKKARLVNEIIIKNNGNKLMEYIGFSDNETEFKIIDINKSLNTLKTALEIMATDNIATAC